MSRKAWAFAALTWFAGVGVFWASRFTEQARQQAERAAAEARWRQAVAGLEAVAGAASPDGFGQRVQPDRLWAELEALAGPRFTPAARKRARTHLVHQLVALGISPSVQASAGGINVVGERPGVDPDAGWVLVGAHYDTVEGSPGVDDNATGLAATLEVLRVLAAVPTRRGLRVVFFDGEEAGLTGSRAYVARPERRRGVYAAVILEMLGHTCAEPGCQQTPAGIPVGGPAVGDYLAVVGDLEHPRPLEAFRRAAGLDRPPVRALPVPQRGLAWPDTRRSDHAPFWDEGVAAVMVTDTANLRSPHYHTGSDTLAHIDRAFFVGATRVTVDAVAALLGPIRAPGTPGDQTRGSSE